MIPHLKAGLMELFIGYFLSPQPKLLRAQDKQTMDLLLELEKKLKESKSKDAKMQRCLTHFYHEGKFFPLCCSGKRENYNTSE